MKKYLLLSAILSATVICISSCSTSNEADGPDTAMPSPELLSVTRSDCKPEVNDLNSRYSYDVSGKPSLRFALSSEGNLSFGYSNCISSCGLLSFDVQVLCKGNDLSLIIWPKEVPADCICAYDMNAQIANFSPGTYNVTVKGKVPADPSLENWEEKYAEWYGGNEPYTIYTGQLTIETNNPIEINLDL